MKIFRFAVILLAAGVVLAMPVFWRAVNYTSQLPIISYPVPAEETNLSPLDAKCGLGKRWEVNEGCWRGAYVKRENSNVFDDYGLINGNQFTTEQTIEIKGNKVYINRYKAGDGNTCTFEGTTQSDGITAVGSYDCTKYKPSSGWRATINCN